MIRRVTATKAKNNFGEVIKYVYKTGEHIIVERGEIPVVVIIPISDTELLQSGRKVVNSGLRAEVGLTGRMNNTHPPLRGDPTAIEERAGKSKGS